MAKNKSARPLLDVFILFLLRDGITTLYRLKQEAGISIGAASPSLRRLDQEYMFKPRTRVRGKEIVGVRGKREYKLGLMGQHFFKSDCLAPFEASLPTDTESVARLVAIAEAEGKPDVAITTLKNAISKRRKRPGQPSSVPGTSSIAKRYRSILQACDTARLKAEAVALKKILASLE